jgi:hypothetical protein
LAERDQLALLSPVTVTRRSFVTDESDSQSIGKLYAVGGAPRDLLIDVRRKLGRLD